MLIVAFRDAPLIGFADNWYQTIVVYTVGKYTFFGVFLFAKLNKQESGFRFCTLLLGVFSYYLHSAVLQVSKSSWITIGA